MSELVFRRLRSSDTPTLYAIFRRTIADLVDRRGGSWPWDEDDDAEWHRWQGLFEHIGRTADAAWGAEEDGRLVGYARSITRTESRELTEFFVLPGAQGRGIGRELLVRAFPAAGVRHRSILATGDPAALSRYLRHGFHARTAVYGFQGRPAREAAPAVAGLVARPLVDMDVETRMTALAVIDAEVLTTRRDVDHAWLGSQRMSWLFERAGAPVGYAYGGRQQGPVAMLDPVDLPFGLATVERHAADLGEEEVSFDVPLANVAAIAHLLGRGYHMDPFVMHLLVDTPEPLIAVDRYVVTSPPFFL